MRVAYVEVVGQRRTLEGLILDLVGLRAGDVLTPEVLDRGQQALLRTGLFFSATLTPRNPEVPEGEKTVQLEGEAFLPKAGELERYKKIYFATWLDGPARQNWPGMVYFVVRPRWIRYSDFDQRPPMIEEQSFGD